MWAAPSSVVRPDSHVRGRIVDVLVLVGFVAAGVLLYRDLWWHLDSGYLAYAGQDQNMWEWFFAVTAENVLTLSNPLHTDLQNFPLGVNLMANTAMLGFGVPLTPVTVLFGPTVTWTLTLSGGIAATAFAWYWLLSRYIVDGRGAAVLGASVAAFAPPIVSHANAHPNFVVLLVIPLLVHRLVLLARGERPVHHGVILGLLAAFQVFVGEESLLIAAVAMVVFAVVYALSRPAEVAAMVRPMATGVAVGGAVAAVLVAVPLWWQFAGPQSYQGIEHGLNGNDLAAFTAYASNSLAGSEESAVELSMNRTEENAFFGWPLILVLVAVTVALWRVALARAVAVSMFVMAWISMGVLLVVHGEGTSIPGPWMALYDAPLLDAVLESRFALACAPLAGILLAMATQRVLGLRWQAEWRHFAQVSWCGALVVALVPIMPMALPVGARDEVPEFFASGQWQNHVRDGRAVTIVPLPSAGYADPLHWQVDQGLEFRLSEGYFVGPGEDGGGVYGAQRTPTSELLAEVDETGMATTVGEAEREQAVEDLRYWHSDVVALRDDHPNVVPLRATVEQLLGNSGRQQGGMWIWNTTSLTQPSGN
ncbi:glycosyl transferase [Saccharomonospora sp. CUA-673]|nr:glycosyl transferase [Saccharomonospora sp. CUA-673]